MPISVSEIGLTELVEQFLAQTKLKYGLPTVSAFSQALHLFMMHLHEAYKLHASRITIHQISLEWGEAFHRWLQESRSVETEHLYMRALLQFFVYLAETTGASIDPQLFARYIEEHRRPKTHAIPAVPRAAIETIIQYAESSSLQIATESEREALGYLRDRAFILTLAYTGLRISEICDLRHGQFDPHSGYLQLGEHTKLELPASAVGALKAYLNARHQLDQQQAVSHRNQLPLFARHDKRAGIRILPISRWTGANIVEAWVRAALTPEERLRIEASGEAITPHTFRHHFVLNALVNTDQDVATTQLLARHSDRSTTRRYLNKLTHDERQSTSS